MFDEEDVTFGDPHCNRTSEVFAAFTATASLLQFY